MSKPSYSSLLFAFCLALLLTCFAYECPAQEVWETNGPCGGSTYELVASPHNNGGLYAAVLGYGIYRRSEEGAYWKRLGDEGLDTLNIKAFAQDPHDSKVLYAGTSYGMYRSADGGAKWEQINGGVSCSNVVAIAIDPKDPDILYVSATWSGYYRVYKTIDAGQTWHPTGPGIPSSLLKQKIIIDPDDHKDVYVCTVDKYNSIPDDAGVYRSMDGGEYWKPSGKGLLNTDIQSITFDPLSSKTLYAGAIGTQYAAYGGVYVSYDEGSNWKWTSTGLPSYIEPNDIEVVYDKLSNIPVLYVAAGPGDYLMPPMTWNPGLYRSENGGITWELAAGSLTFPTLLSLAVNPQKPRTLYTGSKWGGVFRTTNGANSWSYWGDGLGKLCVKALAVHPENEDVVYAGAQASSGYGYTEDAGVWASFNGGKTWVPSGRGMHYTEGFYVSSLAVAPMKPDDTLYAANMGWGLYKSTDYGKLWNWRGPSHGITNYWLYCVAVDPMDSKVAYASAAGYVPWPANIFKTVDGGESWYPIASGVFPHEALWLAFHPEKTKIIYAAAGLDGVFRTEDGGENWKDISTGIHGGRVRPVVVDALCPKHVYLGEIWPGDISVYASYDGGGKWVVYNEGIKGQKVEALAADAVLNHASMVPTALFAGTPEKGVFRRYTTDSEWKPYNKELPSLEVYALAEGPPPEESSEYKKRVIYAGTKSGVAKRYTRVD